ncbi:hypothetical protein [Marinicauda pacifica]|jgi:hypothetical protein|uniref:hypothetical protein n=1 Tax=Marinicauda pacifica TaxID=1133559 RepID=UPI0035C7F8A0
MSFNNKLSQPQASAGINPPKEKSPDNPKNTPGTSPQDHKPSQKQDRPADTKKA